MTDSVASGGVVADAGFVRKAVIVALSIGLVIVLQEFAVRLALPAYDPAGHLRFVEAHDGGPRLGPAYAVQRQIKNTGDFDVTVRFNRYGLRDRKDIASATADDMVLVGDSFAFGWGVEENDRLSERLEARIGRSVYNIATGGGDFDIYEKLLDYAARKGATIGRVVLAVNMENDLKVYERAASPPAPGRARPAPEGSGLGRVKTFLMTHSALYFLSTTLVHNTPWLRSLAVNAGLLAPNMRDVGKNIVDRTAIVSSARRLREIFARYPGVAILIPSRALWAGDRRDAAARTHSQFAAELRRQGVDVLDLRPVFEAGGHPLSYHFVNDAHWNPKGHALAAQALARFLVRETSRG